MLEWVRNVMEHAMMDIMYSLPSRENVRECVVNAAVIEKGKEPLYIYDTDAQSETA